MSNSGININGGKGINTPTADADKNFRTGIAAVDWSLDTRGKPRTTHADTIAFGDDLEAPLDQPVALKD